MSIPTLAIEVVLRFSKLLICAAAMLAAAPMASAQYLDSPFSYNYIDINYSLVEIDGVGPRQNGYGGRLSFDSPEGVRILTEWDETEDEELGVKFRRQDFAVGVGFASSQNDVVDMVLDFKYLRGEQQIGTSNKTESGYGIELGTRSSLMDLFEWDVSMEFREFFISEIGGHTALRFMFSDNFGLGVRYTYFESMQKLTGGIRLSL